MIKHSKNGHLIDETFVLHSKNIIIQLKLRWAQTTKVCCSVVVAWNSINQTALWLKEICRTDDIMRIKSIAFDQPNNLQSDKNVSPK